MYTIELAKEYFHFCAAHFIIFDEQTREELHGHNYYVSCKIEGNSLQDGKLIDVGEVKPILRDLCDELDHKTILPTQNKFATLLNSAKNISISYNDDTFTFPKNDVFLLDLENTTMEHLCRHLADKLLHHIPKLKTMESIQLWVEETQGQKASFKMNLKESHE